MNVRPFALTLGLALLGSGCAPSYTNLTPRSAPLAGPDLHHFEVQWDTSRRGANGPDVKAYVVVGESLYPLQRIPGTPDRWEGDAPIPKDKTIIPYRFKFDYTFPTITQRLPQSDYSPPYFLELSQTTPHFAPPSR